MVARAFDCSVPPGDWRFSRSEASPTSWKGGSLVATVLPTRTWRRVGGSRRIDGRAPREGRSVTYTTYCSLTSSDPSRSTKRSVSGSPCTASNSVQDVARGAVLLTYGAYLYGEQPALDAFVGLDACVRHEAAELRPAEAKGLEAVSVDVLGVLVPLERVEQRVARERPAHDVVRVDDKEENVIRDRNDVLAVDPLTCVEAGPRQYP
eukprot:scaffold87522_cov75-Phaeocystis_antarctica.AAC.5